MPFGVAFIVVVISFCFVSSGNAFTFAVIVFVIVFPASISKFSGFDTNSNSSGRLASKLTFLAVTFDLFVTSTVNVTSCSSYIVSLIAFADTSISIFCGVSSVIVAAFCALSSIFIAYVLFIDLFAPKFSGISILYVNVVIDLSANFANVIL